MEKYLNDTKVEIPKMDLCKEFQNNCISKDTWYLLEYYISIG